MSTDRIIEILLAAVTVCIGLAAFWLASKSTRIEGRAAIRTADAGAFERAKDIYESALATLREDLVATRADLATARSDLVTARQEIAALRQDIADLRIQIEHLGPPPAEV